MVAEDTLNWVGAEGGLFLKNFREGALFLSFIAFLCDNFKIF